MLDAAKEQVHSGELPASEPSTNPTVDPIHGLVEALVENYQSAKREIPPVELAMLQGRDLAGRDLKRYDSWLAEAHTYFRESSKQVLSLTFASEWVLDNYYVIRQAIQQIEEDLPSGYYKKLPKLTGGPLKGLPRIYAITRAILKYQSYLFNPIDLENILNLLQDKFLLTMGELWALPIFLRYSCIEVLAHELVAVIHPQNTPHLPGSPPQLSEAAGPNSTSQSAADDRTVANIILSLRGISEQNWNDFFEGVCRLERILRSEPSGIYPLMDFKTRDLYRKEIEQLSLATGREETELAEITLGLAQKAYGSGPNLDAAQSSSKTIASPHDDSRAHVGEYLLGKSRAVLEDQIGYQPDASTTLKRWGFHHATFVYFGSIILITVLVYLVLALVTNLPVQYAAMTSLQRIFVFITGFVLLILALTGAASLTNWIITLRIPPRILPKLQFKDEIPPEFKTLVVIPAIIHDQEEVDNLGRQLEMQYLRNPEPGLLFALLTDFRDADSETEPEDDALVSHMADVVRDLNEKYERPSTGNGGSAPGRSFYLLHRKRLWNPSERKWMGWERKRGKLHEVNLLLRGAQNLSFSKVTQVMGGLDALQSVRFIITLDADTVLPRGAARRLAGTLAHPLNRARFDEATGQVISGYTVLQPRMEIHPRSANFSWFTRIFSGDTGLDLYTRAVSDAYQDLFGEGNYVGKGIYDVDAFERSVGGRIPENAVLSHDLLEGVMGRAGLVTDITMIEDYPPNYYVHVMRQRRWIRGDWQLLPWLLRPGIFKASFSAIDRWKMTDNLLRSLVAPAQLLVFSAGMIFLPELAGVWLAIILISPSIPLLTALARSAMQTLGGEGFGVTFSPLGRKLTRWALAIAFLPYEAYVDLDAILTTLYRLVFSRRDLLQWTTAAQITRLFGRQTNRGEDWLKMFLMGLFTLSLAAAILAVNPAFGVAGASTLLVAAPLLIYWSVSPLIARWISQPIQIKKIPLKDEQVVLLRQVVRRTWSFFERFVGPEDHWLPPDHFQESPEGIIAHHTSPSNIGLLLTSTLAAYDFGYLDQLGLATRLATTMETLGQLERFRGHFLNWYDTLTLQPLQPRYLSTVDSGNLAASFIIVSQACQTMPDQPIFRWELWQGYLDTLSNLSETLSGMSTTKSRQQVEDINRQIAALNADIQVVRTKPEQWYGIYQKVSGPFWQDLSSRLMNLVQVGSSALDLDTLRKLQEVTAQVERLHRAVERTMTELMPWIPLLEQPPALFSQNQFVQPFEKLRTELLYNPLLKQIRDCVEAGKSNSSALRESILSHNPDSSPDAGLYQKAVEWVDMLDQALASASTNAAALISSFEHIADTTAQYLNEMDFQFLYHPQRRVFHLGFNLEAGQLDNNFYDLLASEARIASIIAVAKGDVPQSHWLQLSRPLTQVEGFYVLLSWSATMFEYLMPPLFLRSYPGTLLTESARGAVAHQIAYGRAKNVPWGISEAGFYRFDSNQNYQYRAFGVPGLGFKRGLGDDLVVAPYASLMAISYDPYAVAQNLVDLVAHGCSGLYGLYESIDFTADRQLGDKPEAVVREYMAHHQGMIMMAMANFFHKDIMVKRMHSAPRIQSVDLLLQEQVPQVVPVQNPYAEDVKGIRKVTTALVEIDPWSVPLQTPIPQVNLLSNGNYNVVVTNMGGGFSAWRGVDLTRWQSDGVLDPWGTWVYIQEMQPKPGAVPGRAGLFSTGFQPIPGDAANMQVTFFAHMAVYRRTENGITSNMEVTVAPDDPVEIRRIHLHNASGEARVLRLTSYGEVILTQQATDTRHPAFNKMFIESEFVPELDLQVFRRRPRSDQESPVYLGHMLVVRTKGSLTGDHPAVRHEADRNRFIGRGRTPRNPAALESDAYLSGSTGATLDPIFALGQEVVVHPHETVELAYLTFAGDDREAVLALATRYRAWDLIARTFHQANISAQTWLGKENYNSAIFKDSLQVLSALLYPFKAMRALPDILASNQLSQSGLWRFGISGDYPILLVDIEDTQQIDLIRELLQVHEYLRSRRMMVDLVILNHQQTDYGAELNGLLYRLVSRSNSEQWLNQRGGIFILFADQITAEERVLLQAASRVLLAGEAGSLDAQMPVYPIQVHHLPEFIPEHPVEGTANPEEEAALSPTGPLQFPNGHGGFSSDGREYIIDLPPNAPTPAPWVNVIGYPTFGFMVSESGSQTTWAANSGENRLTPWFNDPVSDPTGEALYLRDEETGQVWTPTPLPAGADCPYRVTHGAGYTIFAHNSHGIRQQLTLLGSPEDPVKIIHLALTNTRTQARRITATQYVEWVLGTNHSATMQYILPEYDAAESCMLATNPYSAEFGSRVAFLISSLPVHGLTADRTEFIGRGGSLASPIALRRIGLETRITPGEDPCAVMQVHVDLLPGATQELYFVLGQGADKEQALALARKYHDPAYVGAALERSHAFWNRLLDTIKIRTPQAATDLILNRWMLYQSLSCRIWGRSAFYQPSGAFGFRDQLQDVLALLPIDPVIARGQIINAVQRQFEEGDVLHWWHPPSGRGVRTRISDDLLWLPYVTALYLESTGDASILDEKLPFLKAPPLKEGETERYDKYPQTKETYTIMDHCQRAIAISATKGAHGLPLIGAGDWNDGLNQVGVGGKGESVWLGWFLVDVLDRFAVVCDENQAPDIATRYRALAKEYTDAIEAAAWDGAWYRRAYYDDATTLGSSQDVECQIDAIAQSWSVLSGAGNPERSQHAMQSVLQHLVHPQDRLSLLFTPPFDTTLHNPGYVKGYLPGIRENGGQYTHAATWTAWAFARLGDGKQAGELFDMLNPILYSDTPEKAARYRVEPYVICADIYSNPLFIGRGGWTWYTGSAAWMYRLGVEAILGMKKIGETLQINPVIPPEWDGFEIHYRFGESVYHIQVHNPDHVARHVRQVLVDGKALSTGAVPLVDDKREHQVDVTLGNGS